MVVVAGVGDARVGQIMIVRRRHDRFEIMSRLLEVFMSVIDCGAAVFRPREIIHWVWRVTHFSMLLACVIFGLLPVRLHRYTA